MSKSNPLEEIQRIYEAIPNSYHSKIPSQDLLDSLAHLAPSFPPDYQRKIIFALTRIGESVEEVARWADPNYDVNQANQIHQGYLDGLSPDEIAIYDHKDLNPDQMSMLRQGLSQGLSLEQAELCSSPLFDHRQMRVILEGMLKHTLSLDQAKLVADPRFSWGSMQQMVYALAQGATQEQALKHAFPNLSQEEAAELRKDSEALHKTLKEFDPSPPPSYPEM